MKGSISGLSFDIQESAWRDSDTPGKICIATAIRKGDLPNTRILEALPLEPNCPVKQNLKKCSLISQFMEVELENLLKKQSFPEFFLGTSKYESDPFPCG
jgi:hypothetical protein